MARVLVLAALACVCVGAAQAQAQGPAVVVHREPAFPVVSLRLALLADDPAGYAGAGHMVQHILYPALRQRVEEVGGRVEMVRSSDAVIYTVTGPAAELDYLSGVLRSALSLPRVSEEAVRIASRELEDERLAEWETAPSHVRAALRAELFPEDISAAGTDRSAARLTARSLPDVWAMMYRPDRVSVVAVGDVGLAEVRGALGDLPPGGADGAPAISRDTLLLGQLAPAQATRGWVGMAYLASELDPAAVAVVAQLLRADLRRRLPDAQVEVEHWWTHYGQAVAIVAAVPGPQLAGAERTLASALATLGRSASDAAVHDAVRAIRDDLLFYARTPDRMAELLGSFIDRAGDPAAPERFYEGLDRVRAREVRAAVDAMLDRTPARVEIPPQKLNP